jgi:hypothetical protein
MLYSFIFPLQFPLQVSSFLLLFDLEISYINSIILKFLHVDYYGTNL